MFYYSRSHTSIEKVQKIHSYYYKSFVRNDVIKIVSQRDLASSHWVAFVPIVLFWHKLGIAESKEDMKGFVHFWRLIGYLMGLEDR